MNHATQARKRARQYENVVARHGVLIAPVSWDGEARTWDLHLRYGGAQLLLVIDADDPEFVRLLMPNFWAFTSEKSPAVLRGIERVNRSCKCGKVHMNAKGDDVTASVEFLDTREDVDAHALLRYLDMTIATARAFVECVEPQMLASDSTRYVADSVPATSGELSPTHADHRLH